MDPCSIQRNLCTLFVLSNQFVWMGSARKHSLYFIHLKRSKLYPWFSLVTFRFHFSPVKSNSIRLDLVWYVFFLRILLVSKLRFYCGRMNWTKQKWYITWKAHEPTNMKCVAIIYRHLRPAHALKFTNAKKQTNKKKISTLFQRKCSTLMEWIE